jgi:hypothetical protein
MAINLFLSQSTIEKLGYYVYVLIDPRNGYVFYVGKGKGNRINQHLLGALDENTNETNKIKRIRDIQGLGLEVGLEIIRHELTEKEAFEVEGALIDLIGLTKLTNLQSGHHASDYGRMKLSDIKIKYEAEKIKGFDEPMMLININKRYHPDMTTQEYYDATKDHWLISRAKASSYPYVASVFIGIIREVFMVDSWYPSEDSKRSHFVGTLAPEDIRNKYINKSVSEFWKKGSQNPIKYVGTPR